MQRLIQRLEPAEQPSVNRLVVGSQHLKVESFEPVGCLSVDTPSGSVTLDHAARAECRCGHDWATYLFGELGGRLVGARMTA
jgi:hypothetical protein